MGPRSVLLLEGAEHLSRRRVMLPPFHGDRMRAYEPIVREAAEREVASWPTDRPFAVHPRMQAVTLEVILRAVFGVADAGRRERLREQLADLLGSTASPGLQFSVLLSRRLGGPDPLARLEALMAEIDETLLVEIAERRAEEDTAAARDDICSLLVAARFDDGGRMERSRGPRPAADAPARRPRDDGDRAGVDARPAHPPPRRAGAPARRARRTATPTCAR